MGARTGREYPPEVVWQAQELYCVARLTFDQVAVEVGVAASTLKRWSEKYGWREKRAQLAEAEADLRADTILARSAMLKKLINSKDAQTGFAVAALESLAMKQAEAARAGKLLEAAAASELREIRSQEDAATALEDAVRLRLNQLLQSPEDLDFRAVRDIRQALELVREMKPKAEVGPDTGRAKGLSNEAAQAIIDKVLGKGK